MDDLKDSLHRLADLHENEIRVKAVEDAFAPFGEKLFKPGRALVGEGILTKVCKKKLKKRAFFLFTDILIYGTIILHKSVKKYSGQQIFELRDAHVESVPDSGDIKNAFNVFSLKKSFTLMAVSQKEKQDWVIHLEKCIMYCNGGVMPFVSTGEQDNNLTAPVWISDHNAINCMCCSKKFTVINRRHHCRSCGRVICTDCSRGRFFLPNIGKEPQRVCDVCLVKLQENDEKLVAGDREVVTRDRSESDISEEDTTDSEQGCEDEYHGVAEDNMQQGTIASYINRLSTFYSPGKTTKNEEKHSE